MQSLLQNYGNHKKNLGGIVLEGNIRWEFEDFDKLYFMASWQKQAKQEWKEKLSYLWFKYSS
jgi:hypothetical protein